MRSGLSEMRRDRLGDFRSAKADRVDALGVAVALALQPRARGDDRRRGDVAAAAVVDFDHALVCRCRATRRRAAPRLTTSPRAQPRRALHGHAVVQDFGAVCGLHEQLIFVQAEIRLGARRPASHDDRAALRRRLRSENPWPRSGAHPAIREATSPLKCDPRSGSRRAPAPRPARTLISRRTSR